MAIDPLTGLPDSNTIPTSSFQATTPIKLPTIPTLPNYNAITTGVTDILGQQAQQDQTTYEQQLKQAQDLASQKATLETITGGKATELAGAYQEGGVNTLAEQLRNLNAQASALNREALAAQQQAITEGRKFGAVSSFVTSQQSEIERNRAVKALELGAQYDIAKGNYDVAKGKIDQIIDTKYSGIDAEIKAKETQLDALEKYTLTPSQEKMKASQQALLKKQEQELADKKANEKDLQSMAITVSKNGAPKNIIQGINNAKSFNDAVILASPYMQSLSDKADLAYKVAQTAKIYNDMKSESSVDPSLSLAYAQQYASTGQIPTGIPKGSFGQISQWAKELPKPTGTLIDMNTGIKPSKISAEAEKGIASTYDIVNNKIPILREKFDKIYTGLLGGIGGQIITTQDRQDFLTTRQEILGLLLQARSGATVTPQEYERYSNLLPTEFNQTFFLGSDGGKKINSFEKSLTDTLQSKLRTEGAAIYGYSKVDLNGKEYTVGDIIKSSTGQAGRINADGSITLIQ